MFRKDPMSLEWTPGRPAACAARQKNILETVDRLLKPGGTLVYSTCTFAPEENEEHFRVSGPDRQVPGGAALIRGQSCAAADETSRSSGYPCLPASVEGEGHYVARFTKTAGSGQTLRRKEEDKVRVQEGFKT